MVLYQGAAAKERRNLGLMIAKEAAFRETAEEMLSILPKIVDAPALKGPDDLRIRPHLFSFSKKQSPEFVREWSNVTARTWIGNKLDSIIADIGYDFGKMASASVWTDHHLQAKFYKDFNSASYYAGLGQDHFRAMGYNGVAVIAQSKLKEIIDSPGFSNSIMEHIDKREPHFFKKHQTLTQTYKSMVEDVIDRIETYRLAQTKRLYEEPLPAVA